MIDTREQRPLKFDHLRFGKYGKHQSITVQTGTLQSGDYSLRGYEDQIAIERKSKEDLTQSLTRGRDRFIRELERLKTYRFSAVLVECEWRRALEYAWLQTCVEPAALDSTMLAMQLRYPTRWIFRPNRYDAAKTVVKLFHLFLKDIQNADDTNNTDSSK